MKVAIVHDWILGGGTGRVILELHNMFPEAPIYTSYCAPEWRNKLDNKVVTGWLQNWPFSKLRKFIPVLRIWWFSHLDLSDYDLVISSSGNGEAKGVRVPDGTMHICYCHSPTHYYWRHHEQYIANPGFGPFNPLARLGLQLLIGPLRRWDYKAAQRPDFFIANSTHIQDDIKDYYGRESTVIHPPVDTKRFKQSSASKRRGFVTAGRQVPYKKTDLIVEVANKLNLPLTVIGRGPEHNKLVKLGGPTVTFLTDVSDEQMPNHFAEAEAFLFAAFEDFGVVPVEAMAAGTPVIGFRAGGALDYIEEGTTGLFFDEQTTLSLQQAIKTFQQASFNHATIAAAAEQFSVEVFQHKMRKLIEDKIKNKA